MSGQDLFIGIKYSKALTINHRLRMIIWKHSSYIWYSKLEITSLQ